MKFKDVKKLRTELSQTATRVRSQIGARGKDLESRLKENFKAIESQEFLKAPYLQDLMKRVQTSVQAQVENAVDRVETAVEKTSDQVKATVRRGQKNLDRQVKSKGAENLRAFQKKIAQSILERAGSVRASISTVTQRVGQDGIAATFVPRPVRASGNGPSPRKSKAAVRRAKALAHASVAASGKAALTEVANEAAQSAKSSVATSTKSNSPEAKSNSTTAKSISSAAKSIVKNKTATQIKTQSGPAKPTTLLRAPAKGRSPGQKLEKKTTKVRAKVLKKTKLTDKKQNARA